MHRQNQLQQPVLCLYHNDPDGQCAAAVVRRRFGLDVQLQAMDYGYDTPWEEIEAASTVIMVDFSMALADMQRIQETSQLIWIDHHKSAIQDLESLTASGLRALDRSGCVLTWQYCFPDLAIPLPVAYIGERDIWTFVHDETKPFCEGLYQMNCHPANDELWNALFAQQQDLIQQIVSNGEILLQARLKAVQSQIRSYGFEVGFEGHRTLAINVRGTGELGEQIRLLGYEIGYAYVQVQHNGSLVTHVTLYSDQVDASAIAKRFGGGGHPGAAGFSFPSNIIPFPADAQIEFPLEMQGLLIQA